MYRTFIVLLFSFLFGNAAYSQDICKECINFHVSAPSAVVWPSAFPNKSIPDSIFTVVPFPDHFVGYTAASKTYLMSASTILSLNENNLSSNAVLSAGTKGNFDECGAWIHGAHLIPGTNTVEAWYHGESGYCHGEAAPLKTLDAVGYAISTDGGHTFTKPNYPNNIILSGQKTYLNNFAGDGDFSVVPLADKNYMFFIDHSLNSSSVAVASISASGPGQWMKWYNGGFTQPGDGGLDTAIAPLLAGVGYNTLWLNFTGITYENTLGVGFRVALSPDGVNWSIVNSPLIPTGTRWSDWNGTLGVAQYPSVIGLDGSKNWTNDFYLYYMYIRPGDTITNRFLVRSKVTMTVNDQPSSFPQGNTDLERFFSSSAKRHWITSGIAVPKTGVWDFADEGRLGSIFTTGGPGLVELYECQAGGENYFVSLDSKCGGFTVLRVAGFVYSTSVAGTRPIYRCYISNGDHFVSIDSKCEGAVNEGLIGYILN